MVDKLKAAKAKTPPPAKAPVIKGAPKPDTAAAASAALPSAINQKGNTPLGDNVELSSDKKAPEPDFAKDIDAKTEDMYKKRPKPERSKGIDETNPYDK